MNITSLESIKCPVCLNSFDADKYLPKIFPNCGHTVCKECLTHILIFTPSQCPLDKLPFGRNFNQIEDFPTNFLGKDLLEMEGKWRRCKVHQELNKMICLTDNTIICANCGLFGNHKGHEIKLLSDYEELAITKRTQLLNLKDKISASISDLNITLEEKKQIMKDKIKERFSCLHTAIAKQEFQVLFQLENTFLEEKTKLGSIKFDNRTADIETKLEQFSDIMNNPNIVKLLQEDVIELEKTVIAELSSAHFQKIDQMSNFLAIFEDSLPKEDLLKDLNVIDLLDQKLLEFNKNSEHSVQLPQELIISSIPLKLYHEEKVLKVVGLRGSNSQSLEKSELEKVQEVEYTLALDESNDQDKVLTTLIKLSKFLPNLKSVKLSFEIAPATIHTKRILHNILLATFSQPENLENVDISIYNQGVGDLPFIFLAERILPRIKDLKYFSLILNKAQVSNQLLKALTQINFAKRWPNLETFRFDIAGASSLNEKDVSDFLKVVPNVKDLLLGFANTMLNDQAIEAFSTKMLRSLDKLERLEVILSDTKVTSLGVEKFLMNIPNVKSLLLGIQNIAITDDVVKVFLEKKLLSMVGLKQFNLAVSANYLSQNTVQLIRNWTTKFDQQKEINEAMTSLVSNPRVRRGPTHIRTLSQ